ncbi:sugar-binding domain-containing protein [Pedobacter sp. JY14-1]|uniref:glycoside hydrolase family 2 protein n=1 Tax=Pedobacter sp. JY14-1 TaxID=3034151 RepID=UPI0023E09DF4|nr:sugar-binding domain-containing protein [Pedobacter sp. JY14-1]
MNKQLLAPIIFIYAMLPVRVCQSQEWRPKELALPTQWAERVGPNNAMTAYPRPQMIRQSWQNLNGLWQYRITKKVDNLPTNYAGDILVPFPIESSLSGVKKQLMPDELLWYKRSFFLRRISKNERILLHFGGVDWESTVIVNGKEIEKHTGGYTSFSVDITECVKLGNNELIVKVLDPSDRGIGPHGKQVLLPGSIYYTPSSGIWQTVWIETVPINYIKSLKITPDVDRSLVNVIVNSSKQAAVTLTVSGKSFTGMSNTTISIPLSSVRLWSPDDPYLYDIGVSLGKDIVKSYFGMRKIDVQKDDNGNDRIFLNNKPFYNHGVLDQGFWPDGLYSAPTDDALAFDIKLAKAMGFNTIRKHIKVEPARWYYYADKIGMLVWQDMINPHQDLREGAKLRFEQECAEILSQLHNFPSITTWVLFNEHWGQYDQERLTKWIKDSDPSRIVNGHSGEYLYVNSDLRSPPDNPYAASDITDVHSYPNPMMPIKQAGKAQVLGEFGGIGVRVEGHLWDDIKASWGYDGINSPKTMALKYSTMVDSLAMLKAQGLSGSIYTQLYDVETEQNGLVSYDRKIIKIPLDTIRLINERLSSISKKQTIDVMDLNLAVQVTSFQNYEDMLREYHHGRLDSAFLRQLAIMANQRKDTTSLKRISNEYIRRLTNPLKEINLKFLKAFTNSTSDRGFEIYYNNIRKINEILGADKAEFKILSVIEETHIKPLTGRFNVLDWDELDKKMTAKYGALGQESVWQSRWLYSINHSDYETFYTITNNWFEKYGKKRSWINGGIINNICWNIFENSLDERILRQAVVLTSHALMLEETGLLLDTHANLLYKLGEKEKALLYEERAIELEPNRPDIHDSYRKMLTGIPTWNVPEDDKKGGNLMPKH